MGRSDQGVTNSLQRWQTIPRVLCFVLNQDASQVLLLRGAPTKRIWPNRLNGVGGHVERDEDIKAAALREILEETGLQVSALHLAGVVHIDSGESTGIVMFVWLATATAQATLATSDGTLQWFDVNNLPTTDLVDDLAVLLPQVLQQSASAPPFWAHYSYNEQDQLVIAWHD